MEDEELSFSPEQDGGDDDTPQMPEGQSDELGLAFTLGSNDPLVEGSPTTAGIPKAKKPRTIQSKYFQLKPEKKTEAVDLIYQCAKQGFAEKVLGLVQYGVPLDQKAEGGLSAVHAIAKEGRVEMLKMIIEHKVPGLKDVLRREDLGFEGKLKETKKMKEEIVKKLDFLWKNKTKFGWRPLHLAIEGSHVDMVELLLVVQMEENLVNSAWRSRKSKKGSKDTSSRSGKMSPIHIAAKHGSVEVLELMWTWCGVMREDHLYQPFEEQDGKGWNALHHAAAGGHEEVVRWLMERRERCGLDLEARSEKGHTPLLTGVFYKKANVCQLLISFEADVTATANDGMTALHIAALTDDVTIATIVQERSRRLRTKQDEKGDTPLHIANKKSSTQVSELLKTFMDAMDIKNKDGHTPRTILPEDEEYIPQEIRRRGKEAIKIYKNALTFGKTKIPHVKLVVLGKPRHGKTSLLKLLEGKQFVPNRDSTEGIECELVTTSTLDAKFSSSEGQPDVDHLVDMVHDKLKGLSSEEPSKPKKKAQHNLRTEEEAEKKINELFRRRPWHQYPQPARYAQTGHISSNGSTGDLSLPTPLPHDQPRSWVPPKQVAMGNSTSVSTASTARKPSSNPSPAPQDRMETNPPQTTTQHRATPTPVTTSQVTPTYKPSPTVKPTKGMGKLIGRALKTRNEDGGSELKIQFTTYDFAGQELYRPMHHCFITQRSMFLIVYKTREFLEEEEKRHEHIKYWFNTVSAYTRQEGHQGKKPPVFLVGTHRGPYDGDENCPQLSKLSYEEEKKIENALSSEYLDGDSHCWRYDTHLMNGNHFHFVESSDSQDHSSGAQGLKESLLKVAADLPYMEEEYPVRWIDLRLKLSREVLVTMEKVKELSNFGEEELDVALTFFHDIGLITYPCTIPRILLPKEDKEKLKDVILCGPQRLADNMKEVFLLKNHLKRLHADDVRLLRNHIATRRSLKTVFSGEGPPLDEDYLDYICLFLRAYGLLFPIDEEESKNSDQVNTQYLITCQLEKNQGTPREALRRSFSFDVDCEGYLPDELFVRFICMAASKARKSKLHPPARSKARYHLTRDYCNVDSWKEEGDQWEIWRERDVMKMAIKPPHRGPNEDWKLTSFVHFAWDKFDELCKGLGAINLRYACGKQLLCTHCKVGTFYELKPGEDGEMECWSCNRRIPLEEELQKEFKVAYLREKPSEQEIQELICKAIGNNARKLCTMLGIELAKWDAKSSEKHGKVEETCFDCLVNIWLRGEAKTPVEWSTLLGALRRAEHPDIAEEIERRKQM